MGNEDPKLPRNTGDSYRNTVENDVGTGPFRGRGRGFLCGPGLFVLGVRPRSETVTWDQCKADR